MIITTLLVYLLEWISLNTTFDTSKFDFPIFEVSKEQLQEKACGGKCPILAFFNPEEGVFVTKLDLNEICNQSIILHELIHVFQYYENNKIENIYKEKQAYEIQNEYLFEYSQKNDLLNTLNVKKCRSKQTNKLTY